MQRKRTNRSSWSGTAAASEHVGSHLTAAGAVSGAPIQVVESWEQQLLAEFAACMDSVATEAARGEEWATARCRALQQVVACATEAMLEITAQATQAAAARMGTHWDEADTWDWLTPAQRETIRLYRMG